MLVPKQALSVVSCATRESTRYAIGGVLIERDKDGVARTVATDGRRLAVVTWPECDPKDYPFLVTVDTGIRCPGFCGVLATKDVKNLLKSLPKNSCKPALENIAIQEQVAKPGGAETFECAATDLEAEQHWTLQTIEGSFPNWQSIVPEEHPRAVRIRVNAKFLADACKLAFQFPGEYGTPIVELTVEPESSGPSMRPLCITAEGEAGKLTYVIMPVQ